MVGTAGKDPRWSAPLTNYPHAPPPAKVNEYFGCFIWTLLEALQSNDDFLQLGVGL